MVMVIPGSPGAKLASDAKPGRVARIPLSGRPNNLAIGKDDRRVYVGIHNVYVTPNGKYVVSGNAVTVVNTATLKVIIRIPVGQVPKRNGTALIRGLTPNQ